MRRHVGLALVAVVLLGLAATPVFAATEDEPRFEVYTPSPRLDPGEVQTVTVELVNDAEDTDDRVPTATAVRVEPRTGRTPFEVRTETVAVGRMADGEIHEVDVRLSVPADTPGGTYRIPLRVNHEYDNDERETDTVHATVRVPRRPIFRVSGGASGLRANETGTVTLTVENTGSRPARWSVLEISAPDPGVALGEGGRVTPFVGTLSAGEARTVTVEARAAGDVGARAYPLEILPTYHDRNNVSQTAPSVTANVSVGPRQSVGVRTASLDLYGTSGVLTATVENAGPAPVRSAVATLTSSTGTVRPIDGSDHVGLLHPGNATNVSFIVRIRESASPGPHPLEVRLRYDRGDAETYRSDPAPFAVSLPEDRSRLDVETVAGSLEPDASNAVDVRLTYEGGSRLTELRARLGVAAPYESAKPSAFVGSLEPGESTKVSFEVTAPEDAVPGSDSLPLHLTGELPDGRTVVERDGTVTLTYPTRAGAEDDVLILAVGAVVVLLVLGAGAWWLRH